MASRGTRAGPADLARSLRVGFHSGPALLVAFAFAVMADPVSSVAYAIEAALRALHGDLALLLPTMALVVAIIALVITNYHQLVARFPEGGGAVYITSAIPYLFWREAGEGDSFARLIAIGSLVPAASLSGLRAELPACRQRAGRSCDKGT